MDLRSRNSNSLPIDFWKGRSWRSIKLFSWSIYHLEAGKSTVVRQLQNKYAPKEVTPEAIEKNRLLLMRNTVDSLQLLLQNFDFSDFKDEEFVSVCLFMTFGFSRSFGFEVVTGSVDTIGGVSMTVKQRLWEQNLSHTRLFKCGDELWQTSE